MSSSLAVVKPARGLSQRKCTVGINLRMRRTGVSYRSKNIVTYAAAEEAPAEAAVEEQDPEAEQDMIDVNDIRFVLSKLYDTRNMTFSEVKLILLIEDPRAKMRRESMGVEDDSGVSRDDICECLQQIQDGYMPGDRMSLRKLAQEMREWPYLQLTEEMKEAAEEGTGAYASITDTGVQVDIGEEVSAKRSVKESPCAQIRSPHTRKWC